MKLLLSLLALLTLSACVPALVAEMDRQNGEVEVFVTSNRAVYDVNLVILNAELVADERCAQFSGDVGCMLGDFPPGNATSVRVTGDLLRVECVAYGFLDEGLGLRSYRPFACSVRERVN